ncbi:hypothetical protein ABFS82_04G034900 [Erythranthe guttata]
MLVNFTMKRVVVVIVVFVGVLLCSIADAVRGVSVSCMVAYEEGGVRAVFSSPECPQWVLCAEPSKNMSKNCQFATLQGHRKYQEDRVTCNLDMKLPFSGDGEGGPEEITIGIAAIFDGHGGEEASEMASRKLSGYFLIHSVFIAYKRALSGDKENHVPLIGHRSLPSILEEALLRTIQDIDTEFSKEAFERRCVSGSTATIVLLVNGEFLIANVGDSKAILCSKKGSSLGEVYAEELTKDHHPDREDEKTRIEAAGGFVTKSSIPRVNGVLAVSRAIGDVFLKRYGVTAEPEVTGWRPFSPEDMYLVVASDGIFETLNSQNVCDLLDDKASSSSLSDRIVRSAFRTGSTDNLSVIVISDLHN